MPYYVLQNNSNQTSHDHIFAKSIVFSKDNELDFSVNSYVTGVYCIMMMRAGPVVTVLEVTRVTRVTRGGLVGVR